MAKELKPANSEELDKAYEEAMKDEGSTESRNVQEIRNIIHRLDQDIEQWEDKIKVLKEKRKPLEDQERRILQASYLNLINAHLHRSVGPHWTLGQCGSEGHSHNPIIHFRNGTVVETPSESSLDAILDLARKFIDCKSFGQ